MILHLRPRGRGNWKSVVLELAQSKNAPRPLDVYVGQLLTIGGHTFRVAKVIA